MHIHIRRGKRLLKLSILAIDILLYDVASQWLLEHT